MVAEVQKMTLDFFNTAGKVKTNTEVVDRSILFLGSKGPVKVKNSKMGS